MNRAFPVFEMFLVVAFLAILGSIGFVTVSDVLGGAKQTKLLSDVKALNSAVLGYIASNGDLSSAKTPRDVIAKLKSVSSNNRYNGMRQSFLDSRINIELQSVAESSTETLRVYWDSDSSRFVVASSGPPGIKAFILDDSSKAASADDENSEDRGGLLSLAQEDPWIWDFVEAPPAFQEGPTVIPTADAPPTSVAPVVMAAARAVAPITPLSDPIFSIPPASYPITAYDLNVTIVNPNPSGSSDIYYRLGFGSWQRYTGSSILTQPGTNIQAQAISSDPGAFENSSVKRGAYEASPILLRPPLITPDNPEFALFGGVDIEINISDSNLPGTAILQFRIDGSPWMDFTTPILLPAGNFPGGAEIEARAISSGSPYYLTSLTSREFIPIEGVNLSGNTVGEFSNPQGPGGMVSNLDRGNASSYFEWGDAKGAGLSESWMEFYGGSFTDIVDGQQFSIGSLTYYNGSILSESGADTIDLDVTLDLDINGRTFRPYFDFTFELINTVNTADSIASADIVYLDDARSSRTLVFDGHEFEFELRFGETTADGFSDFDRFNVIENRDASVNLYGTFNLLGPATDPGAGGNTPILGGLIIDDDPATGAGNDFVYQKVGYLDPEEFVKSLLGPARELAESAKSSRDIAIDGEEDANKASIEINSKIDDGDFIKAEEFYLDALEAADLAEAESARAEAFALEAQTFLPQVKEAALNDSKAVDEAIEVTDQVNAAAFYATRARDAAIAARLAANTAETAWNRALSVAPTSNAEALARYYAERAKLEREAAKSAREQAEDLAKVVDDAASEMSKKIAEGKYFEAETHFNLIAPNALQARNAADAAATAALRSREAAIEATALAGSEAEAIDEAEDADREADMAESESSLARGEADAAAANTSVATAEWDSLIAAGATGDASAFATYLADRAEDLEARAKSARDDAKSASEEAVDLMEDSGKKALEGKLAESDSLAQEAEDYSNAAEIAAELAMVLATDARSLAVQTGVIASNTPGTMSTANEADRSADNATDYAQEARQFADTAANALP